VATVAGVLAICPDSARNTIALIAAASCALWLLSFGPLKGLPYNLLLSVLHVVNAATHVWVGGLMASDDAA